MVPCASAARYSMTAAVKMPAEPPTRHLAAMYLRNKFAAENLVVVTWQRTARLEEPVDASNREDASSAFCGRLALSHHVRLDFWLEQVTHPLPNVLPACPQSSCSCLWGRIWCGHACGRETASWFSRHRALILPLLFLLLLHPSLSVSFPGQGICNTSHFKLSIAQRIPGTPQNGCALTSPFLRPVFLSSFPCFRLLLMDTNT